MKNILLTIEYDGTAYSGWQNQDNALSVQEVLEKALKRILREDISLTAAGRTDSGVHAECQAANFRTASDIPFNKLKAALNSSIPRDIRIKNISLKDRGFDAQRSAKGKIYRYRIYMGDKPPVFMKDYVLPCQFKLDVKKMREAAALIKGKRDFSAFMGSNGCARTFVRSVKNISIKKTRNGFIDIAVEADGFLYNMVRVIAGTLFEVGRGKMPLGKIKEILRKRDRRLAGPTLPAKGLTLVKVNY
jgi:tRNA pseudouridine38-40 synthase